MPRRFIVQTDYKANARDVLNKQDKMSRSFGRFATQMADGNSTIGRSFGKLNQSINRVAMIGMVALVAGAALATREYIKFDQTITGANARFVDFVAGSEQSKQTLEALKVSARETGATTQFMATEAAAGLNFFAKAGFTSAEAMAVLESQVDLATVAEADFNRAADISSDLLGALGKNADDSATKIANLKEVNRALAIATNAANVDLEDLFETLKIAGPIGTAAGESMNALIAQTAALGSAGIKGGMAATALKNAFLNLAAPTDKVHAALASVGLAQKDFIDQQGKMKSMTTIMQMLGDASKDLGDAEQLGLFSEIFGKRAVAGAINLSDSLSQIDFVMSKLEADTKLKDLADEIRRGLGMQVQILKSGLIELGFQFVEAFEKDGRGALQGMIDTVQKIDIKPIIKFAKVAGTILKFIASNWKILLSLAVGIKAISAAMVILSIVTKIFGVTLNATPMGKLITLVFILATAITWLVLNWDKVVEALVKVWDWMKRVANVIWTKVIESLKAAARWIATTGQKWTFLLGPLSTMVSVLIEIVKQWGNIRDAFSKGGMLEGIKAIGRVMISSLLAPIQGFLELVSRVPGVGNLAAGGAAKIAELRAGLGESREFAGKPETPTPSVNPPGNENALSGRGIVDINIRNQAGDNADIKQTRRMRGVNINFAPAVSE